MANELIQKKTGSATDFELVPKGSAGDVVTQGEDGKHEFASAKVPGVTPYTYEQVTAAGPGSGIIRFNHTDLSSATKAYVNKTNTEGNSADVFLAAIGKSDALLITSQANTSDFYYYGVGLSVDQGTYYEIDIILLGFAGTIADQAKVLFNVVQGGETNWQYQSQQVAVKDGSPTYTDPDAADVFTFFDSNGNIQITQLRDMAAASRVDAIIHSTDSGIVVGTSYQAIPMFTDGGSSSFYASAGVLTKSIDHTGITTVIPIRYKVEISGTFTSASNTEFTFAVLVNGVECDLQEEFPVSGDGVNERKSFSLIAVTDLLSPNDQIQLGVKNNNDTISAISATMWVEFAGAT